jgi:hypothetical protein
MTGLNAWPGESCRAGWAETAHPEWPQLTVADVLQAELTRLMPLPLPFDGHVKQAVRVPATALARANA